MALLKVAAIVGAGLIFTAAPASAGLALRGFSILARPDSQVEQVRYYRSVPPGAIIGGVIAGVMGGVVGGDCYFNDCGYGGGPYYGSGGNYGGGERRGGGR